MTTAYQYGNIRRSREAHHFVYDFLGQAFLQLEPLRSPLDNASELRQSEQPVANKIADSDLGLEGKEMVLAHGPHFDSADDDQLPNDHGLEASVDGRHVDFVKLLPPPRPPTRSVTQGLGIGIVTKHLQQLPAQPLQLCAARLGRIAGSVPRKDELLVTYSIPAPVK
jgi:hypothetical protein